MSKCSNTAMKNGKNSNQRGRKKVMKKLQGKRGITLIALVITTVFSYDENVKSSNNKGFLLQTI